jgi:hypothetical protein
VFGLNKAIKTNGNSNFDVLYGEESVFHVEREIQCEHGLQ